MLFDDRLGTVLRLSASGPAVLQIQFRQLLDLLGTCPADARGEQLDQAYLRLGELAQQIPADLRAKAISDAGLRLRSPRLVAVLAAGNPVVAAAAVSHARLTKDQWLDLIPAIPPAARNHLNQRRDLPGEVIALLSRLGALRPGLPPTRSHSASEAVMPTEQVQTAPPPPEQLGPQSGISAIVKRIEAFRRAQQGAETKHGSSKSPQLPLGEDLFPNEDELRAFDFATDQECRINWSDPGVIAMVCGVSLTAVIASERANLLRRRQPLRTAMVELQGGPTISGQWILDAAPWFDPIAGRFLGYRGRMRRPPLRAIHGEPVQESQSERMRQVLHELRTPVNAIQGFAEVIQQQLFGPTPHEYRAMAAEIVGDSARILAAFEELDRFAKLDSKAMDLGHGETDLAAALETIASQLSVHLAPHGSGFSLRIRGERHWIGMERVEAERILWRILATLAGACGNGEILKASLEAAAGTISLVLALPAALATTAGDSLFVAAADAIPQSLSAGTFGVGFSLRLARAEAQAAGGNLCREGNSLLFTLPVLGEGGSANPGWAKDHSN